MKELVRIKKTNNGDVVSAWELYNRLGLVQKHWVRWYKRNILNNEFCVENEDYTELPRRGRSRDFAITIRFAKKVSMATNNEAGEKMKDYFLKCEEVAKSLQGLSEEEKQGLSRTNQVNGTHSVKEYLIKRFGKSEGVKRFIQWSKYSHKTITGRTTKQTKELGKKAGLKSVQRASAKEVCRNIEPHNGFGHYIADLAAQISGDARLAAGMGKAASEHLLQKNLPIKTVTKSIVPF